MEKLSKCTLSYSSTTKKYTFKNGDTELINSDAYNSDFNIYNGLKVSGIPETFDSSNSELFTDTGYLAVFATTSREIDSDSIACSVYYLFDSSSADAITHNILQSKNGIEKNVNYESYHLLSFTDGKFVPIFIGKHGSKYVYKADCDMLNDQYMTEGTPGWFEFANDPTSFTPYFRFHQMYECSPSVATMSLDQTTCYYTVAPVSSTYTGNVEVW